MAVRLVLETTADTRVLGSPKNVGENVFLIDLPEDCRSFAFYYPGPMPEPDLENGLRALGAQTGRNLFVNIGRLNDPSFDKITSLFDIRRFPVVVITAAAPLAAPEASALQAFVRLDAPRLLASPERTLQCVQRVSTLFLRGAVSDAIAKAKATQRSELLRCVGTCIKDGLGELWKFVTETDVSVSLFEGRLELMRAGG